MSLKTGLTAIQKAPNVGGSYFDETKESSENTNPRSLINIADLVTLPGVNWASSSLEPYK